MDICFHRRWACLVALVALCIAVPLGAASALDPTKLSAEIGDRRIDVYFYRPEGAGPFPLAILSHGSPRDAERRGRMGARTLRQQAEALVRMGAAVEVPIRRGYGGQGAWAEGYGRCRDPDYVRAGLSSAEDIRAALQIAAKEPGIDRGRTVLIGHSAGGWGSLAAASELDVLGVVSFAGGRGSSGPADVCGEERLVAAAGRFGRTSRAPELWIYSRNDLSFGPDLAGRMHAAFVAAGGRADLLIADPYGRDGHRYIDDVASWLPEVERFLRRIEILR